MNYYCKQTKFGFLTIEEENDSIVRICWEKRAGGILTDLLTKAFCEIEEYMDKKRKSFDLPLSFKGTDFQQKVWKELLKIPFGTTCSYKDVAIAIGNPNASRAVGMANNKNPLCIVIPCHRVVGLNGRLTGYAGGLIIKEKLLLLENSYKQI